MYNCATKSDDNSRSLICLATTQELSVQADGAGSKRLFLHKCGDNGGVGKYWLEEEQSCQRVGGEQLETKEEREDALARGKTTSEAIGIKAMGKRFNVLMTIQIPLEQSRKKKESAWSWLRKGGAARSRVVVEVVLLGKLYRM